MKIVKWDSMKDQRLKLLRKVGFQEILNSRYLDTAAHCSRGNQQMMLFERLGYVWVVPFVEGEEEIFLKTLYPSRKYTKLYRRGLLR